MCLALEQIMLSCASPVDAERAERRALVFATLAVLTKDQVAGALFAPVAWLIVAPAVQRGRSSGPLQGPGATGFGTERWTVARALARPSLWKSAALCLVLYALASGALVNPVGWLARLRFVFGPASRDWAGFARTVGGRIALAHSIFGRIPELTSWPSALLSAIGIVACVVESKRRKHLLPVAAALSFTATFNALALRSEHRFLLVQAVLLAPYAALVVAYFRRSRAIVVMSYVAFFAAWATSLRAVASLDGTLIADSRYRAERFLASVPPNSRVEVMGGPKFLPRLPAQVIATRVGLDALGARSAIPGVREVVDDPRAIDERRPDYLVLSVEFATPQFFPSRAGSSVYTEATTLEFFRRLALGRTSYTLAYRATCELPWPLVCVRLHSCTGGDIAIYKPRNPSMSVAASPSKAE
jgi:hypothetical protein